MAAKYTTISVEGDQEYKDRLRSIAAALGLTTGQLVRHAIDQVLGDDLETHAFFFESVEQKYASWTQSVQQVQNE